LSIFSTTEESWFLTSKEKKQNKTKQERVVACLLACPPQFSQKQDNLFAYLFTNWQLSFPTTLAPHPKIK
jgi:hypothetical protein